ncbi:unnamed protein product [Closterium sp. Naga37s-1]|nr:unnamed protein product [Closterium sp. Naga37s-1]
MAVSPSELDVISRSSEIVPDSIVGGQFESFKPTAATVSSSLILGVSSLGEAKERSRARWRTESAWWRRRQTSFPASSISTDYLVVPLKVLEALKDTPASPDLKPAAVSAAADKVKPWDMARFMAKIGPCARQLLQAEIDSAVSQAEKVDKHFKKIWPPPNEGEEVEEEMGESVAAARVRVRHELYAPIEPYRSGTLAVSDVHTVYWEESGNPNGQQPVIFLHGGPGGGTSPANRRFFDPTCFRIVLLDQRGAGRSTPHACLEENTTWHLVEDIETLRKHLGVDKWLVFGGSWGSTLSLVYAATHPDRVAGLILRGIFLLRRKEVEWFYQKGADSIFPDAFDKYREFIPKEEQHDLVTAYHKRLMNDSEPDQQVAAARHWTEWEIATSYLHCPFMSNLFFCLCVPCHHPCLIDHTRWQQRGTGRSGRCPPATWSLLPVTVFNCPAHTIHALCSPIINLAISPPGGSSTALDGVGDAHQLPGLCCPSLSLTVQPILFMRCVPQLSTLPSPLQVAAARHWTEWEMATSYLFPPL